MRLIDILILTNTKGLGHKSIAKVLNFCQANNVQELKYLNVKNLHVVLSKNYIEKLEDGLINLDILHANVKRDLQRYTNDNISCLTILDDEYPELLKNSTNPPVVLYYKGDISLLNSRCVAVIGTRDNTYIGKTITQKSVDFLVENDFTVVSGLAKGIDEIAHVRTLSYKNSKTIAVLPSIDTIYPFSNKQLAENIVNCGGLLIAEVKPYSKYHSGHLVKRDRIQSGLSKAVFVIETKVDGGSMHAVNDALKLKRNIYCPDISTFDNIYQNNEQVKGIKFLIENKSAIAYNAESYENIVKDLQKESFQSKLF